MAAGIQYRQAAQLAELSSSSTGNMDPLRNIQLKNSNSGCGTSSGGRSITNEFLKQVPLLKNQGNKILLVCATNYIRQLDEAMLRPGRFDCIIPVGGLDKEGSKAILQNYLSRLNIGEIDLNRVAEMTTGFTPADIEYLFQKIAQFAFEQELATEQDYRVTTENLLQIIPTIRPSLTDKAREEFEKEIVAYSRF